MATNVTGDLYMQLDGKLHEIKRQVRQKDGYPYGPERLNAALQAIIEGRFEAVGGQFPSQIHAADLIPKGWVVVEDVPPTEGLEIGKLEFLSFLNEGESYVYGEEMRKRAVTLRGNLGFCDTKRILEHQTEIPVELQEKCIILPGTLFRRPGGSLFVPCLSWGVERWNLHFRWLSIGWVRGDGDDNLRLARCK